MIVRSNNRQNDVDRITNQLKQGLNATTNSNQALFWSGNGIVTSSGWKGGSNYTGIGVTYNDKAAAGLPAGALYTTFDGQTVGVNDVLVKYTWFGDADLDGQVTSGDFDTVAANFNLQTGGNWSLGDFNNDGAVNALDFNAVATNYGAAPLGATALSTLVPEPAVVALFGALPILVRDRARRSARR